MYGKIKDMRIAFIPIDNRPVCYSLAKDIASLDDAIEFFIPPREYLGDLKKVAGYDEILSWLNSCQQVDAIILSLDTIAHGGLVSSRRSLDTFDEIKNRVEKLKKILLEKNAKVYAFSSIMRISNNNYNEEEKEYWAQYGKKIFEYSYNSTYLPYNQLTSQPSPIREGAGIPQEIIEDYLATRKRNFEINKLYLEWQKEGIFDTLIFSKDDCAEFGFNVEEARELENLGGKTKTGADEIPLTLLARAIEKDVKIFVEFTEPDCKNLISNYEDVSIEKSVFGQLELGGFSLAQNKDDADLILVVNNFREKQGELVMGWETGGKYRGALVAPNKSYCIADVRYANGADNDFVAELLPQIDLDKFYGYAGWNTSANTLGSLLAGVKVRFNAKKYNEEAFKKLQLIRFLDDWAYQANVRGQIERPCDISNLMKPYEEKLIEVLGINTRLSQQLSFLEREYLFPWNRKFEVEVVIK